MYFEKFALPFILLRVDLSSEEGKIYYVWLQKYIKKNLDVEHPDWRGKTRRYRQKKLKGPWYTIKSPVRNALDHSNLEKLESIACRIKYLEELTEFMEVFGSINRIAEDMASGACCVDTDTISHLVHEARKLSRLPTLIKENKCGITSAAVRGLIHHFSDYKGCSDSEGIDFEDMNKRPFKEAFLRLLRAEAYSSLIIEDLQDEACRTTVY